MDSYAPVQSLGFVSDPINGLQVVDTNAADALSKLEKDWLKAEGKLQETVTPAQTDAASGDGPQVRMLW